MQKNKSFLEVYWIAGTQDIPGGSLPKILEEALESGITCFQYREKGKGSLQNKADRKEMARICQNLCRKYQVPFIVNDDVELALEIEADGIHVGQEDQNILDVQPLFKGKIVGLSCYDEKEINAANQLEELSYYGIGPVFGTVSKEDAKPPIGVEKLRELVNKAARPAVAVGGINTNNITDVLHANVAGAAVISVITRAAAISRTVEQLKGRL